MQNKFHLLAKIFRSEYYLGLFIGAIGFFLLWYQPAISPPISIIVLTFSFSGLFYLCGYLANSIWDAEVEINYKNEKNLIAKAVFELGKPRLKKILFSGLFISILLSILLSFYIKTWIPLLLFFVGVISGVGYSSPPFRWKEKGFLYHSFSLGISAFFLPVFLVVGVLTRDFSISTILLGIGYTFTNYGLEIGNQLKDFEYDKVIGIKILPFISIRKNCFIGLFLIIIGLSTIIFGVIFFFRLSNFQILQISLIELGFHSLPLITYSKGIFINPDKITNIFEDLNYSNWQLLSMTGLLGIALIIR